VPFLGYRPDHRAGIELATIDAHPRITRVSPLSSNMGTRVWPRFPDPPVRSTFIVFSPP
jgi:hypothetical protein